ncbi:hypothetical protein [Dyadobacter luticola]|uniref:Uncharacterized protein n=1 Tax=Dyadobacter luticola TaxID=1979387 RepID=A0A5R9L5V7_9BACT|nr:hypothetical protein [Dyadobacter luticola]TLV03946.1 hypothetical protein FEN17_10280 [Dyadobacter luticola]
MENVAPFAYGLFTATVILSVWLFWKAARYSKPVLLILLAWILLQSVLGLAVFYEDSSSLTSRFSLLVVFPVVFLGSRFFTKTGKKFIDSLDIKGLTIFHIIRIPVEITLLYLFLGKTIPEAMTFEGRNFDILSGLTAPVVYYFAFIRKSIGPKTLIAWNVACMLLLINVVSSAVLSLPDRYQQFGFEQPNIAVGYFPFLLLPAVLVPLALFSSAAAIRQMVVHKKITHQP